MGIDPRNITIAAVHAHQALDSRGNPTVEATVELSNGIRAYSLVPSGASTGSYEALELRDGDNSRFGAKGVLKAAGNVNDVISPHLIGMSPLDQSTIDQTMIDLDGTPDKSNLGANGILAVSMAIARAASLAINPLEGELWSYLSNGNDVSLPVPMFNILNGGRHASNSADIQEFMVMPVGVDTFSQSLRAGAEIYQALRSILEADGHGLNVGDEGGFAPTLASNRDAIEIVLKAINKAGYSAGEDVFLALDVAASELFSSDTNQYDLAREGRSLSAGELIDLYDSWSKEYPIISIEDGLDEDDWSGWTLLRQRLGGRVQLVGDDLLVTNINRIKKGIGLGSATSVLLKPNQIGTLTETFNALTMAREAGWGAVMSHRSGETEDTTIADLSVAWDIGQIKTGAPARSERVAKYNRLLRIEASLAENATYSGSKAFDYLSNF